MSRQYFNLDESELDTLLMINLFPKRISRINFSDRKSFDEILMPELVKLCDNARIDFINNLVNILTKLNPKLASSEAELYLAILYASPKHLKLAVLITIDELKE